MKRGERGGLSQAALSIYNMRLNLVLRIALGAMAIFWAYPYYLDFHSCARRLSSLATLAQSRDMLLIASTLTLTMECYGHAVVRTETVMICHACGGTITLATL